MPMALDFFVELKCASRTIMLSLGKLVIGIKYYVRDLIYDVNSCA